MARLVTPSASLQPSFLAALAEYHADALPAELDAAALADPQEFARYVAALVADMERPGEPDRYAAALTGAPAADAPQGGYVPQTILWWVAGDEYLGRLGIRHYLNEGLRRRGGHIGFEVRPGARGLGHATVMLGAALPLAAGLHIHPAHVDCDRDNVASRRVIEKNGGLLEREEGGSLYFLVPTR